MSRCRAKFVQTAIGFWATVSRITASPNSGSIGPAARTTPGVARLCQVLTEPSFITNRRLNETGTCCRAVAIETLAGTRFFCACTMAWVTPSISRAE